MVQRRRLISVLLLVALGIGGLWYLQPWRPRVEVGGIKINPHAALDPNKNYTVVVWDWELPLLWSEITHAQVVQDAVRACMAQYPNIRIELVVKGWDESDQAVHDALAGGNPPDVLGMPRGVRLLSQDYQIPLERFLTQDELADLTTAAQRAVTHNQHIWAIPRWLNPTRWVIHTERWPTSPDPWAHESIPPVYTRQEWEESLTEARTKNGSSGLALNILDPWFFYSLMVSATGRTYLDHAGNPQWSEESIYQVAHMLQTWVKKGFIPKDVEAAARTRLGDYWSGSAIALAPTNSWLLHHLFQRSGMLDSPEAAPSSPALTQTTTAKLEEVQRSVMWTLPPLINNRMAVAAVVSGYGVFRQAEYKGHDHTQAAVTVARFLSRKLSAWEATQLFAVPAYYSEIDAWITGSRLPEQDLYALLTWTEAAVVAPLEDHIARLEEQIMLETALPRLIHVLQGTLTPEEFARELVASPVSALAEFRGP
jgi:hypothetical protein